jgi:hypothetical protein
MARSHVQVVEDGVVESGSVIPDYKTKIGKFISTSLPLLCYLTSYGVFYKPRKRKS